MKGEHVFPCTTGTQLSLLLRDAADQGIQFLDTTEIHVEAVVDELLR
jgi:aspartate/glutamate racemase